ncbi:MAG: hypothetical protein IT424_06220 [Pirellulales bacterium]|nr:hypothetical protein [Pirellulales bacterium]
MIRRVTRAFRRSAAGCGERLRRLGDAAAGPFERAMAAAARRLFRTAEQFERVDYWLLGAARLLLWPVAIAGAVVSAVGRLLVPAGVRSGARRWGQGGAAALAALGERLNLDEAVRRFVWISQPVWRPLAALAGFAYVWLSTRPYRRMRWGLPALVLLTPVAAAAGWGVLWGRGSVAAHYQAAVAAARDAGDYERMQLYQRKLAQLGADTRHSDFKTAVAVAEQGRLGEAYTQMERLAPADRPGFAPAHFWIVQQLLSGALPQPPEEGHRLAGQHLDQLDAARIDLPELVLMRATWLVQGGRLAEASEKLKPLIHRLPPAAIQRLSIDLQLNREEEAKLDARAVATALRDRQLRGAAVDAEGYHWWSVAEALLGDEQRHAEAIAAWQQAFPEDAAMKSAKAHLALREFDLQVRQQKPNAGLLSQRIADAAEANSEPAEIHRRIALLLNRQDQSPEARDALAELTGSTSTPPLVLQSLGTQLLLKGQAAEAAALLKRSLAGDDRDATAWNNYACALLELPGADMNEALRAVERAVSMDANSPQFRETRGQVLVRLHRWEAAIEDLELAINGLPPSKAIHRSLAEAYAATGQEELALLHRGESQ